MADLWDFDDDDLAGQTQLVDEVCDARFLSIGDVEGLIDPRNVSGGPHTHNAIESDTPRRKTTERLSQVAIDVKPTPEADIEAPGDPPKQNRSTNTGLCATAEHAGLRRLCDG